MSLPECWTAEDSARALRKLSDGFNQAIRANCGPMTSDSTRRLSVGEHLAFRKSIAPPPPGDEIDDLVADIRRVESDRKVGDR